MTDRFFLDTNVLVYARDSRYPDKQKTAAALVERAIISGDGCLSMQVLEEFYRTVTGKLMPGLTHEDAQQAVRALRVLHPIPIEWDLLEEAWAVEAEARLSWWDSLIVAAALRCGCTTLYSEDLAHEMRVRTVEVRNPFRDLVRT